MRVHWGLGHTFVRAFQQFNGYDRTNRQPLLVAVATREPTGEQPRSNQTAVLRSPIGFGDGAMAGSTTKIMLGDQATIAE